MPQFRPYQYHSPADKSQAVSNAVSATLAAQPTGKLSDRAMLIDLTISAYAGSKKDPKVAAEIARQHGSAERMGSYTKLLLPAEALAPITQLANAIRTYHRTHTLPWLDSGSRILASAAYFDYTQQMRTFKVQWDDATTTFVNAYPAMRGQAKVLLNGLFDPNDYPDPNRIGEKFNLAYTVYPFPDSQDFRLNLSADATAALRAQLEQSVNAAVQQATMDIVKRMRDVVGKMAERLSAYKVTKDGVENRFHDTLVSNIGDLITLVPILNITGDPNITKLAMEMTDLIQYHPQQLRDDDVLRKDTAERADAILKAMEDFV